MLMRGAGTLFVPNACGPVSLIVKSGNEQTQNLTFRQITAQDTHKQHEGPPMGFFRFKGRFWPFTSA